MRGRRAHRRAAAQPPRVQLGRAGRRAVLLPADEHLLVLGPTGSGKSTAVAVPALLEWPGAAVVTDPKGELLATTWRQREQRGGAVVFAPLMQPSHRWNPLASVRSSEDAARTASFLIGRPPEREPFWHDLARQLLHALLVEASHRGWTLADALELVQTMPAEALAGALTHPLAVQLLQGALSGGERTAMGVVATLVSRMGAFSVERVGEVTGASDFDPAQLASGELRTLYCVVTPQDAQLVRGLISALLAACWRALYAKPPSPPALFVLDEFAQLTELPELPSLVQLGRSQGVRMVLIAQDLASVHHTYGPSVAAALWSNCRAKLLLPGISEVELLEKVSQLAGQTTLHRGGVQGREAVASHRLLHPDDVRRLPGDRALLLHGADHPAIIRQRPWYRVRALRAAAGGPTRVPSPSAGRPLQDWIEPAGRQPDLRPLDWRSADQKR